MIVQRRLPEGAGTRRARLPTQRFLGSGKRGSKHRSRPGAGKRAGRDPVAKTQRSLSISPSIHSLSPPATGSPPGRPVGAESQGHRCTALVIRADPVLEQSVDTDLNRGQLSPTPSGSFPGVVPARAGAPWGHRRSFPRRLAALDPGPYRRKDSPQPRSQTRVPRPSGNATRASRIDDRARAGRPSPDTSSGRRDGVLRRRELAIPILWLALNGAALAGTSALYGAHGELWDPLGRLPDFSYAGYGGQGEEPPSVEVSVDVTDFGATGDGSTDDTEAFVSAIAAGGAIWIPTGTYRLTEPLYIEESGVVLRGEDRDRTILLFENSLEDIYGPRSAWSWSGGLIWIRAPSSPRRITDVTADAHRGDTQLVVRDTGDLAVGQRVVLAMQDPTPSLGRELHNQQADPGDCDWQVPLNYDWPVELTSVGDGEVGLSQPLRIPVDPDWNPRLETAPFVTEIGIEDLTLRFRYEPYAGHLEEPGFNGIFFEDGVADSWVRRVTIQNSDNGVIVDALTKQISVLAVKLRGRDGHHGVTATHAADCLFSEIHWEADFRHDFTLDHRANGNVIERASSDDLTLSLDHHGDAPHENLFTEFFAEVDFYSGGSSCSGPHAGARQTYWNLYAGLEAPEWDYIQSTLVGDLDEKRSLSEDQEWLEPVSDLEPANLFRDQLEQRLGTECDLSVELSDYSTRVPQGGTLSFVATASNSCDDPLTLDRAVMRITGPASVEQDLYHGAARTVTESVSADVQLAVPSGAPLGTYTVEVGIVRNGEAIDTASFEVEVVTR